MVSKIESAVRTLREEGPLELGRQIREELFPPRDRLRELEGPAADLYDCFIFYNELDLLEVRLNELSPIVDKFVIVEATETFQGDSKELFFRDNKDRFEKFNDKIIHHVVDYPDYLNEGWEREFYLRDSIQAALKHKSNISIHDEVIISDADEIPSRESVRKAVGLNGVKIFSQSVHYYYFNLKLKGEARWLGPVMAAYKDLTSPQDFRNRYTQHLENPGKLPFAWYTVLLETTLSIMNTKQVNIIDDGGWHFSYLGDIDYIVDKIESFSHSELNKEKYKDPESIKKAIREGEDLFEQGLVFERVNLGSNFPQFVINNKVLFHDYIID